VENVRLTGLVDVDGARARAVASQFDVPFAATALGEVADRADAVILAAPPHVHASLAGEAFQRGLHVLCEKPMANSAAECRQMMAAARDARRVLAMAHTYRYFPNRMHARSMYAEGRMGRMLSVDVEQGAPCNWPSRTGYTLRKELVPGGVLFNEGVHVLDMLLWWFGEPEHFEYHDDSLGGLESNVRIHLRYRGAAAASFRLSRTCELRNRVEMQFERGRMSFLLYDMSGLTVMDEDGKSASLTFHHKTWDFGHAAVEQLRDFADAVLDRRPPSIPGAVGTQVVEFIEACYRKRRSRSRPTLIPQPGVTW